MTIPSNPIVVRHTRSEDFSAIHQLTRLVYPASPPWSEIQLSSHLALFPEGQFVAVDSQSGQLAGMAASLIVLWDDYKLETSWRDFTGGGMFTNHDPQHGRTLYAADIMVHPAQQGRGIGKQLYAARRALVERLGLLRIRAGARLRHYHLHAERMSAREYALKVVRGELGDPTLSFQLRQGFHVLAVVEGYLANDPESLGHAAVIEWINPQVARPEDWAGRDPAFAPPP
jgi:GNAT superfamily N-acetyltransferase